MKPFRVSKTKARSGGQTETDVYGYMILLSCTVL